MSSVGPGISGASLRYDLIYTTTMTTPLAFSSSGCTNGVTGDVDAQAHLTLYLTLRSSVSSVCVGPHINFIIRPFVPDNHTALQSYQRPGGGALRRGGGPRIYICGSRGVVLSSQPQSIFGSDCPLDHTKPLEHHTAADCDLSMVRQFDCSVSLP